VKETLHIKHGKGVGSIFLSLVVAVLFFLFAAIMYVFNSHVQSAKTALSILEKTEIDFQIDLFGLIRNEAELDSIETKAEFAYFKSFLDKYVNIDGDKRFDWYDKDENGHYVMETISGHDTIYNLDTQLLVPTNRDSGDGLFNIVSKKDPSVILVKNVYPKFGPAVYDFLNLIVATKRIGGPKGDPIIMRNRGNNKMLYDTSHDCGKDKMVSMNGKWMISLNGLHPNNMNPAASDYIYHTILSEQKYEGPFYYFFTEPRVTIESLRNIKIGSDSWFRRYPIFGQADKEGIEVGWTFVLDQPFVDIEKGLQIRITYAGQSYEFTTFFEQTYYDYKALHKQLDQIIMDSSIKGPLLVLPFMIVLIPLLVIIILWFKFITTSRRSGEEITK